MKKLSKYQIEILDAFWIVLISIFIRINSLAPNSLWQDDSYVALTIKTTSFEEFKLTAGHHPGFSALLLSLYKFFGFSELLFQIPSFALGILLPGIGYLALKRHNFSRRFSLTFGLILASSPTLVLVSSRVKPYSAETFIAVLYLYFLSNEKTLRNDICIFFFSLVALLISYYSLFVIGAYYLSLANFRQYKFHENRNLYFGFGVLIFFLLSYKLYLNSLPLISAIMIHPHVFYDWPIREVFKGVFAGFNSMTMATLIPVYLLKWTSYDIFAETSRFYNFFYSGVSLSVLFTSMKIFKHNNKLGSFVLLPFIITVTGALLGYLVWGKGVPEQYRMLSSLIPCYAIWILFAAKEIFLKLKLEYFFTASVFIFVFMVGIFYIKFNPYFLYPQQDYRAAIQLINQDVDGLNQNWLIKTTDGTSPGAVLYDGSSNVKFGPGLIFSSSKSKSELVDLSDSEYRDIEIVYTIYINKDYDLSYLGFSKEKLNYSSLGNLFISKWKK